MAKVISKAPFQYIIPVVASLAAANSATRNITFDQDSKFIWTKTTYFVDLSAAAMVDGTRPIPLLTVAITNTGSGRLMNSAPCPIDSMAGYKASEPYLTAMAFRFAPNSTLSVVFANYSAATTYTNIYLVLHEIKEYLS